MEYLNVVVGFLSSPAGAAVLAALLTLSEALAMIPQLKANSVLQLVMQILSKLVPSKP